MTLTYAMMRPKNIAAIAGSSANFPLNPKPGDFAKGLHTSLPVLMTHGSMDRMMPYQGGFVANIGGACNRGQVVGAEQTRDAWLQVNQLKGVTPTIMTNDSSSEDAGPAICYSYQGENPVEWWLMVGAGHTGASKLSKTKLTHRDTEQGRGVC